jgi:polysaccharide biosynthesis transport protein
MRNLPRLKVDENELLELDPVYQSSLAATDGYAGAESGGEEQQQLKQILLVLRRNWLLILVINVVVTAVAIVYVAQRPDYFRATARVQVNAETNPAVGTNSGGSVIVNSGSDPVYFTTQLQIIEGAGLLRRVVKALDLENNPDFLNTKKGEEATTWQNVMKFIGFAKPTPSPTPSGATLAPLNLKLDSKTNLDAEAEKLAPFVSRLKGSLQVAPVKDNRTSNKETRLIEVQFTHQDRYVAAKVVNAIADIYAINNLEQKIEANNNAGDFLQKRVNELQSQIRLGEERLINYSKENQILSLDGNQNIKVQKLTDLNVKLGQATNDRIIAEIAYRAATQNSTAGAVAESKDSRVAQIESSLVTLRQRLAQLSEEYTDNYPDVINLKAEIAKLEKELQTIRKSSRDRQIATLEHAYNEALNREKELSRNFEAQRSEVIQQNEAAINYRILQQEIETSKKLLDNLLQRSRENDVILNGTPNNVSVVDRALVPRSPIGSQPTKDILIAFLGSLGFGVGLAFLRNWIDDRVRYGDDLERQLKLPLLAAIPLVGQSLSNRLFRFSRRQNRISTDLVEFEKPAPAESYTKLRTYLLLSNPVGLPPKTILVTSGESGEGKSTTALNLAKTLADFSEDVLLIDADLRLPQIHLFLRLGNKTGLSFLLRKKDIDEAQIQSCIEKIPNSNLSVLTAGQRVANPVNLLGAEQMRLLLSYLSGKYSYIVIDSPPALYFSDSVVLSTLVDTVVLVARENQSSAAVIKRAKKVLQDVGARIAGIVLNGVTAKLVAHKDSYKYYDQSDSQNKIITA